MIALRPHQEAAVAAVLAGITRRLLLVRATGGGKTVVAAALSQRVAPRTLFVVHREELVQQAVATFRGIWPGGDVGIVRGPHDEHDRRVVVASIQTLQQPRRAAWIRPSSAWSSWTRATTPRPPRIGRSSRIWASCRSRGPARSSSGSRRPPNAETRPAWPGSSTASCTARASATSSGRATSRPSGTCRCGAASISRTGGRAPGTLT